MRILLVTVTLVAPCAAVGQTSDMLLGGHVKGFVFQQLGDPWKLDRSGCRLQLAVAGGSGEPAEYFAAIDFELDSRLLTSDQALRRGEGFDIYPVEIYINLSFGSVELRAGKQLILWGRTEWVMPTDVITAWDYANMASDIEDYRLAPLATRLNWHLAGELMFDLVWLPIYQPNRIISSAPTTIDGLPVTELDPLLPEHQLKNGEFGLRISHSISRWAFDWAISCYRGFDKSPAFVVTPVMAQSANPPMPIGFEWTRRYEPLWMVGVDFAKATGSFVFKGEGAIKITNDWQGNNPNVRNSRIEYVLGFDYNGFEDLDFGAQYGSTYLLHFVRRKERADLSEAMASEPRFVERSLTHEASLRVRAQPLDDISAQLFFLYNFTYRDSFLLGFVSWSIADALTTHVGAVGFAGADSTTPYGRLEDSSRAFVELKYSF